MRYLAGDDYQTHAVVKVRFLKFRIGDQTLKPDWRKVVT